MALALVLGDRGALAVAACGDGVVDPGEACDPGPDLADDCCAGDCTALADGSTCYASGTCQASRCAVPITVKLVRLQPARTVGHRGTILVRGDSPPTVPFAVTQGLAVRVQDGLALDRTVTWTVDECRPASRGGVICLSKPNRKAQISRYPDRWGIKLRLLGFEDLQGPFQPPVTVTITHDGGVDRVGTIAATCKFSRTGVMLCQ